MLPNGVLLVGQLVSADVIDTKRGPALKVMIDQGLELADPVPLWMEPADQPKLPPIGSRVLVRGALIFESTRKADGSYSRATRWKRLGDLQAVKAGA